MKKGFWGYNVKRMDELVYSLQNQNDMMTTKLTALTTKLTTVTMELNAANAEIEKLQESLKSPKAGGRAVEQLNAKIQELEKDKNALQRQAAEKLALADMENKRLNDRIKELSTALARRDDTILPENENTRVIIGSICERAYMDMERMRRNTATEMEKQVDAFSYIMDEYSDRIQDVLVDIKGQYGTVVSDISKATAKIFESLKMIESSTQKLGNDIAPIKSVSSELTGKIKAMIDSAKVSGRAAREKAAAAEYDLAASAHERRAYTDYNIQESNRTASPAEKQEQPQTQGNCMDRLFGVNTKINIDDILKS